MLEVLGKKARSVLKCKALYITLNIFSFLLSLLSVLILSLPEKIYIEKFFVKGDVVLLTYFALVFVHGTSVSCVVHATM